jgi:hypothetical protein
VRSIENPSRTTIESIIIEWISKQLKIAHLINQAITNLSFEITRGGKQHKLIKLLAKLVEGVYSYSQVCFLSTAYTFTCGATYPSLVEMLQKMELDRTQVDVKIDIRMAHALVSKCFTEEISMQFLQSRINEADPMLDYVDFLADLAKFFGDKHKRIYSQAKSLLSICGSSDHQIIIYEIFEHFMIFLGHDKHIRDEWKTVLKTSESKGSTIKFSDLLTACAENKDVLMDLLSLPPLIESVATLKTSMHQSAGFAELHRQLVERFAKTVIQKMAKLPQIPDSLKALRHRVRESLLLVDVQKAAWYYRLLVMKIDKIIMTTRECIPVPPHPTQEQIANFTEYLNRTESAAWALWYDS